MSVWIPGSDTRVVPPAPTRLWGKPSQISREQWTWSLVSDPADWAGTTVLSGDPVRPRRTRERALLEARAWAEGRGEYQGDLP